MSTTKASKGRFQLLNFVVLVGLHILAVWVVIARVILAPAAERPSLGVWILATGMFFVTVLGITCYYHRGATHGGYKPTLPVKVAGLIAGGLALQGPLLKWAFDHRCHHAFVDLPGLDPHTPYQYQRRNRRGELRPSFRGFLWSHIGWLFMAYVPPAKTADALNVDDLEQDRLIRLQQRFYYVFAVATFAIPFAIAGWDGLLIAGVLRVVVMLNVTWATNSFYHIFGSPVEAAASTLRRVRGARNVWVMAIPSGGESYHALHHALARCVAHGWKWWQIDLTKYLIWTLERLRLIREVAWMRTERQKILASGRETQEVALVA